MKKLLTLFAVIAIALTAVSCKSETPKFDLEVVATVFDSATNINFGAQAIVLNVPPTYFVGEELVELSAPEAKKDAKKLSKWLDKSVKEWCKANVPNDAEWSLHIRGYVKYFVTIEIDETFPKK